jgi:hypothetical protein
MILFGKFCNRVFLPVMKKQNCCLVVGIATAVAFWTATPCDLAGRYWRFGRTSCLHIHDGGNMFLHYACTERPEDWIFQIQDVLSIMRLGFQVYHFSPLSRAKRLNHYTKIPSMAQRDLKMHQPISSVGTAEIYSARGCNLHLHPTPFLKS